MADVAWIEIYSSYTSDELTDAIDRLKGEISIYRTQSLGSKSFERDLQELKNQLQAAIRVKGTLPQTGNSGVMDFSGVCVS